jgi:hypothetical protein
VIFTLFIEEGKDGNCGPLLIEKGIGVPVGDHCSRAVHRGIFLFRTRMGCIYTRHSVIDQYTGVINMYDCNRYQNDSQSDKRIEECDNVETAHLVLGAGCLFLSFFAFCQDTPQDILIQDRKILENSEENLLLLEQNMQASNKTIADLSSRISAMQTIIKQQQMQS